MTTRPLPLLLLALCALLAASCSDDSSTSAPTDTGADATPHDDAETNDTPDADDATQDVATDTADDTTAPTDADDAAPDAPVGACGPDDRAACLYHPERQFAFTVIEASTHYTDRIGQDRVVNIAIYRPTDAPTPMPVVLLSHGGSAGKTDPRRSMEHWAPVIARAGYLAVAIAHEGRDEASYDALCQALEVNPTHPCGIKVSWDRPHDVAQVLAFLHERDAEPQFEGLMDLDRVAHVGHSAGAGAALMSVGATRNFRCALPFGFDAPTQDCQVADLVSFAHDEIDLAIALSPQGPGSEGFMEESYGEVTRPVLMATGANDGDEGEPANRLAIWPLLPAGSSMLFYVDDQGAKHTLFEGSTEACEPIAGLAKCEAMREAIFSLGVAYLDAHLRGRPEAAAWLASDDVVTAGQGLFTTDRR